MTTETVLYADGATALKGYLAYDETRTGKRPGVLVMPEAFGLGEGAKMRARMLSDLGYVALAGDPYGDGKEFSDLPTAMGALGGLMADASVLRARVRASLDKLASLPNVDASRLAVMGYCMGGTCSLEMARDGAPVRGVVSFHGGLQTQRPAQAGQVKAKVLVCHGADDPLIPAEQVAAFIAEMNAAGANWEFISYGGAVHSFTNKDADGTMNPGIKYNAQADARSWRSMASFFEEIFSA